MRQKGQTQSLNSEIFSICEIYWFYLNAKTMLDCDGSAIAASVATSNDCLSLNVQNKVNSAYVVVNHDAQICVF